MSSTLESRRTDRRSGSLPRHLAGMMRPELPSLADEIIAQIRVTIPEYARPLEGPFGLALRTGVHQALTTFVDLVADPDASYGDLIEVCRNLGRSEARQGRSLDALQAAYRVGIRVSWHRIMDLGRRAKLSSAVISLLADAVLQFMDELASQSQRGYLEEQACSAEKLWEWRHRLLVLILERPPPSRRAVEALAARAGWVVPREVTMVAVQAGAGLAAEDVDGDLLAELEGPHPHLLVPGTLTRRRQSELAAVLAGCRAAAGLTVPLAAAADSLRWARELLALGQAGIVDDSLPCSEDHMLTLWLLADVGLADQLARRELGALAGLSPLRRRQLMQTLTALLETRGTASQVAGQLGVHPQTVRYRIKQLEQLLGEKFTDPDARFAMEVALRAGHLRDRVIRPATPARDAARTA